MNLRVRIKLDFKFPKFQIIYIFKSTHWED